MFRGQAKQACKREFILEKARESYQLNEAGMQM